MTTHEPGVTDSSKTISEYTGEPPKTAAPAAAPVGEQPGPQNVMVLVAGADRLEPLDRALRYKRSEDTVFLVHGVELWNKLQMLSNAPGSFYVRLGVESCVGKEQASVLDVAKTNQHIKDKAMHELAAVVKQAKETKKGENIQGWLLTGDKSIKDLALDFAVRHKIDHIFIGDHDKSLRALGSFADYVVMHAGCDVTVVKHR